MIKVFFVIMSTITVAGLATIIGGLSWVVWVDPNWYIVGFILFCSFMGYIICKDMLTIGRDLFQSGDKDG